MTPSLKYINITTLPGGNSVFSHDIAFKKVLLVELEGTQYDIIRGSAPSTGERKVQLLTGSGKLQFANDISFAPNSSVYVLIRQL